MLKELRALSGKTYNPMSTHIRQAIAEYLEKILKINLSAIL